MWFALLINKCCRLEIAMQHTALVGVMNHPAMVGEQFGLEVIVPVSTRRGFS